MDGTGLIYLRARYYDPDTGRFLSRDNARGDTLNPITLNRYVYARDNPLLFLDLSGHFAIQQAQALCDAEGLSCENLTHDMAVELLQGNAQEIDWTDPSVLTNGSPIDILLFVGSLRGPGELREGYTSFRALKEALGSDGAGNAWHHIVEQRLAGRLFSAEEIHSADNVIAVRKEVNQAIANHYSRIRPFSGGLTVRKWLESQSFAAQSEFGRDVLDRIRNNLPLP